MCRYFFTQRIFPLCAAAIPIASVVIAVTLTPTDTAARQGSRGETAAGPTQVLALDKSSPSNPYQKYSTGVDVSYPQCKLGLPAQAGDFAIIGVNGGRAFTTNRCLNLEYAWAKQAQVPISFYLNLNFPSGQTADRGLTGPKGECPSTNLTCQAYNYGWNAAADAKSYTDTLWTFSKVWWIDIETYNTWEFDGTLNSQVIQGAIDFLRKANLAPGIYTAPRMWAAITDGNYDPQVPIWIAGAQDINEAKNYCGINIGSGPTWLSQFGDSGPYDHNLVCP